MVRQQRLLAKSHEVQTDKAANSYHNVIHSGQAQGCANQVEVAVVDGFLVPRCPEEKKSRDDGDECDLRSDNCSAGQLHSPSRLIKSAALHPALAAQARSRLIDQ